MTHLIKINILTGHEEMGNLHFILKIIFHCIFIEKPCIFSKLVQFIMKVYILSNEISLKYLLYPRHLCRGVYSFRLDVCPFVRSYVRSFVRSCVRSFVTFRHVRRIYIKVFG